MNESTYRIDDVYVKVRIDHCPRCYKSHHLRAHPVNFGSEGEWFVLCPNTKQPLRMHLQIHGEGEE